MSKLLEDFLREHTLNLMLDYYSGLKQVRAARASRRKVCSIIVPLATELVEASGSMPVSLYRLGRFIADRELRLMRLSRNLFGTKSLINSLGLINMAVGPRQILNIAEKGILGGLWKIYDENINIAKEHQYPLDACFGTRIYYGSLVRFQKEIDFSIGYGTRCGWFTKFFEASGKFKPMVFIDIPIKFNEDAIEYEKKEIMRVMSEMEKITGKPFSEGSLVEEIKFHNSIAESYEEILKIWAKDVSALSPLGFIYVLSMLHFGYTDRLSKSSKYFDNLLKNLLIEFKSNLNIDLREHPKLLMAPMFGGFDPEIMKLVSDLGGRLLFTDWRAIGVLDRIKENGDPMENYADYLLNVSRNWCDNSSIINNWMKIIDDLKLDGVIFNSVYGCKSFTPAYKLFKDRLLELEVPIIDISFHNMGENVEQLKTRLGAFLEMIRA